MNGRPITRTRWSPLVLREPMLTNGTRLLLVVMAERMRPDGQVRYPRPDLAQAAGVSQRQVQRRLAQAVEAGWLHRCVAGHNGRHAVYQATVPLSGTGRSEPSSGTSSGTLDQPSVPVSSGTPTDSLPVPLLSVEPRHVAGHLRSHSRDRASASEHGALDCGAAAVPGTTTSGEDERQSQIRGVVSDPATAHASQPLIMPPCGRCERPLDTARAAAEWELCGPCDAAAYEPATASSW